MTLNPTTRAMLLVVAMIFIMGSPWIGAQFPTNPPARRYSQLLDVNMSGLADGNVPSWNATSGKWVPSSAGAGDMTKAIYDTGDNGKVDTADNADALGGTAAAGYLKLTGGTLSGILLTDANIDLQGNDLVQVAALGVGVVAATDAITLAGNNVLTTASSLAAANLTGTIADARLPGTAWMFSGTSWEGPFSSSSGNNVCGYTKYVVSGGSHEACAVAVETSQTSIQDKEFWCTVPVFADPAKTQLATSDAIVIRWMAANTSSAICKMDVWIYGDNGGTDTLVYNDTGLTVTTENVPMVVTIARASLDSATIYSSYKFRARLYTKRDSSVNYKTGIIDVRVKGEAL